MTLAITYEQIEAEIRQQGLEEGQMQRSREIAIALLQKGMASEEVARLTKLPIAVVEGFASDQSSQVEDEVE